MAGEYIRKDHVNRIIEKLQQLYSHYKNSKKGISGLPQLSNYPKVWNGEIIYRNKIEQLKSLLDTLYGVQSCTYYNNEKITKEFLDELYNRIKNYIPNSNQCYNCDYYSPCQCDGSCYTYSGCTCDNTCHGFSNCSCYVTCYQERCTCNSKQYYECPCYISIYSSQCHCYTSTYTIGCSCNNTCYGYSGCSCNNTCNGFSSCSCDRTCYGYSGCSCNNKCYRFSPCICDYTCNVVMQ